jgi:polyketide cyclase/dehydrase/lipid transport protein
VRLEGGKVKIVLMILGAIIGLLLVSGLLAVVIGSRLPSDHTVSRSLKLHRNPADVYAIVRNVGATPNWRPDVKRVDILSEDKFREHGSNGAVTYQIVEDVPNQKLVTKIVDVDLGYSGSWEYNFEAGAAGTTLTITERGIVSSPLFRFFSRYVFGHTATIDAYFKNLERRTS